MNDGSLLEAVQASVTLPVLMAAIRQDGRYLVDGSLVNPIPVNVLKEMGTDFIIAVNVSSSGLAPVQSPKTPSIFRCRCQGKMSGFNVQRFCQSYSLSD